MVTKKLFRLVPSTLLIPLLGSTCTTQPQNQSKARTTAALRAFSSPDELRSYLASQAQVQVSGNRSSSGPFSGLFGGLLTSTAAPPTAIETGGAQADSSANSGSSNSTSASDPFSTTNIQEEGVDESDIVKNDGQSIYALDSDKIHVVQAIPASGVTEIATITLQVPGDSLYLKGTTLVAISRQYAYYYYDYAFGGGPALLKEDVTVSSDGGQGSSGSANSGQSTPPSDGGADIAYIPPFNNSPQVIVTLYDVSDPAHPALKATATFEGSLADSRLIESKLHLILATTPTLPDNPTPVTLRAQQLDKWIPDFQVTGPDGGVVNSGDVVSWEHVFRPEDPDGYGIVTVVTLDIDQPTAPFASTSITADAGVIYASPKALYIADTNYDYTNFTSRVDTAIHKLVFTEEGTTYAASGIVPGRPLNQYSLGEHKDNLRIATHIDPTYFYALDAVATDVASPPVSTLSSASTAPVTTEQNAVYVLSENTDMASLDVVGKVENIAPGEQIYAARFVGDRGFLVTFHRVDPLFTLDLSNPTNPFVAGQLKVPGYSDHIQLLDENHLLTIGKDVQDAGTFSWMQGVQVSIFDVTDLANPTLVDKAVIGGRGTSSEANYNPKAFNYFAAKNALAFPIDDYSGQTIGPEVGKHSFTGLYVFHVSATDGFDLIGRIASDNGIDNQGCFYGYYGFTRGVFIGSNIYAVTQRGVKVANLDDFSALVGQTTFATAPQLYPDCYLYGPTIAIPEGDGLK